MERKGKFWIVYHYQETQIFDEEILNHQSLLIKLRLI